MKKYFKNILFTFIIISFADSIIASEIPTDEKENKLSINLALLTGLWAPLGNNKVLGNHPEFELNIGIEYAKFQINMNGAFRFLKMERYILLEEDNVLYATNDYLSSIFGFDVFLSAFKNLNHNIGSTIGVSYEKIEILTDKKYAIGKNISIETLNYIFGVKYFYFFNNNSFILSQINYNLVDNFIPVGPNFSGHALNIKLGYGISFSMD
ncbi:MAG: hypothetical protein OEZ22_03255 [Spirochaetia bacterium]|nr:hypothetical protein [Spirochaetia bacterium]